MLQPRRSVSLFGSFASLLLLIGGAVIIYLVSPLRDPSFQPNSANAGTLIPWLQGVRESHWIWGVTLAAGITSVNLTLCLHQISLPNPGRLYRRSRSQLFYTLSELFQTLLWLCIGFLLFSLVWAVGMGFLMAQWLVD